MVRSFLKLCYLRGKLFKGNSDAYFVYKRDQSSRKNSLILQFKFNFNWFWRIIQSVVEALTLMLSCINLKKIRLKPHKNNFVCYIKCFEKICLLLIKRKILLSSTRCKRTQISLKLID